MSFRKEIKHPANLVAFLGFGLIVAVYVLGYTIQDHRPPEEKARELAERYIEHHHSGGRASIKACVRQNADNSEVRTGIEFYINCDVEVMEGNRLFYVSVAFGRRNQIEFSDVAEARE